MIKETNAIVEARGCKQDSTDLDMCKPIQDLFDECLNFISINSFDV